jgi:Tfp pilus assembly protein PilV
MRNLMKNYRGNNRTKKDSGKGEFGFTLVETSIALVVLMVAGLGISSLFIYSMQNNVGGNERALAMAVAQQQLEQLRSVSFDDATLAAETTTLPTVKSGGQNYSVVRRITEETNANGSGKRLKRIAITVTPERAGGPNWIRLSVVLVSYRSSLATGPFLVPETN